MPQLIHQPFHRFTYVTVHSTTLPLLHLCHSSFYNPSIASPMPQLIHQPFHRFTYVTVHSTTLPLLHLCHSSFCLILQLFHCFTYTTAHSPTLPSLHLSHSSFYNPSIASLTSQALHLCHLASCLWYSMYKIKWKIKIWYSRRILFLFLLHTPTAYISLRVSCVSSWEQICLRCHWMLNCKRRGM